MFRWWALVAILTVAVTAECFNTRLWWTPYSLSLGPSDSDCHVWRSHMRVTYASHANGDASEIIMHDQYTDDPAHQFVERFSLSTGALVDAAPLEDAPVIYTAYPSMCHTNYDIFVYTGRGNIDHYDLVTGKRRASTTYEDLARSDRVSLVCTNQRVFASVPATQAVWELLPQDGLLTHVVARIPSPGAMYVRGSILYVVSGRPAVAVYSFDLDTGATRGVVPADPVQVRGIVVQDDGTVLALSDERATALITHRNDGVSVDVQYAPLLHELVTSRLGVRNGVVVDVRGGAVVTPTESALTNMGNVGTLSYPPTTLAHNTIVLADATGELALFTAVDECKLQFEHYLAPMQANAGLVVLDIAPENGSLLYLDHATGSVWARIGDGKDRPVETSVVDPVQGAICAVPVPRACLLGSQERVVRCHDLQAPSTVDIPLPDAVHTFHCNTNGDLMGFAARNGEVAIWRTSLADGIWTEHCIVETELPPNNDQWHVHQVAHDAYIIEWRTGVQLLVDDNCTLSRLYEDNPVGLHVGLAWLDVRSDEDAVCAPLNTSFTPRIPHHHRSTSAAIGLWLTVGIVFTIFGCVGCLFFAASITCRTAWFLCIFRRNRAKNSWQQLQDNRRVGIVGMFCCNRTVQTAVYSALTPCPGLAERFSVYMQRRYSPPVYSSSDMPGTPMMPSAQDESPGDPHWANVDLGESAASAAKG